MKKESIYNYYLKSGDYTIMYNQLSNCIDRIPTERLDELLHDIKVGEPPSNDPVFIQLVKDGFFPDSEYDESAAGEIKYLDAVYANSLEITVLATEQCNFRCKYCYEDFKRGNITKETISSFLRFMKKNIHKYNMIYIDWFGGEPLLAVNEIEYISGQIIDMCKKNGKPYFANMTTNGYYLTADMIKRMLACKVYNYQITLDGSAEGHNKTRVLADGGPTFETIIANLKEIRDNVHSKLFKILLRTNISKIQGPTIDEYIQFIHDEFGNDSRFECYFRPAGDWGGSRVKSMKDSLITTFAELYGPLLRNISKINVNAYIALLKMDICPSAKRNSFVLGSDGTIYKCSMLFNEDFNRLGRLSSEGNLDIDQYKYAKWVSPVAERCEKCISCKVWSICHNRSCPARVFTKDNSKRENCGYEKKSLDYILRFLEASGNKYIKTYETGRDK